MTANEAFITPPALELIASTLTSVNAGIDNGTSYFLVYDEVPVDCNPNVLFI